MMKRTVYAIGACTAADGALLMLLKFFCSFLQVYIIVMFVSAVLSWFPIGHDGAMARVKRVLFDLTEPVLAPARRVIPPAGGFDLSFMVVMFVLILVQRATC